MLQFQTIFLRPRWLWLAVMFPLLAWGDDQNTSVLVGKEVKVSPGDSQEVSFEVPDPLPPGQARMAFKARIDNPDLGGMASALTIEVNGKAITRGDMLNKPTSFLTRNGTDFEWAGGETGREFMLFYSPDFSNRIKTAPIDYGVADTDPYGFVWDISAMIKPGKNVLRISGSENLFKERTVVLKNVNVEFGPAVAKASEMDNSAPPAAGDQIVYEPIPPQTIPMDVKASGDGGFQVTCNKRVFSISTRSSLPDGKWLETKPDTASETVTAGTDFKSGWKTSEYEVHRVIKVEKDHLAIADTFKNTSDHRIGIIVENNLSWEGDASSKLLVGGRPCFTSPQIRNSPPNPTAVAEWSDFVIGVLAEGDIFRIHGNLSAEATRLGLADPQLGLDPGAEHTLEWSIYPVPNGNYWTMINEVRRNWGSNFKLEGPLLVYSINDSQNAGQQSVDHFKGWLDSKSARFVMATNSIYRDIKPGEPGYPHWSTGTGVQDATEWLADVRAMAEAFRQLDPKISVLPYLHPNLTTEPNAETLYDDSHIIDSTGKQVSYSGTPPIKMYLSSLDTKYGVALMKIVHFFIEDVKTGGIYMDEFAGGGNSQWDYATKPWDGCTAIIDPSTHALTGIRSSSVLLQQPWKAELVRYLRSKDKVLLANMPAYTRTMLSWHIQEFVEGNSFSQLIETQLGSPWLYGIHFGADCSERLRMTSATRCLDYGGVYTPCLFGNPVAHPPHWTSFLYPITPIELHPGVLIGEERILTNRSGVFGWGDRSTAEIHVWDQDGEKIATPQSTTIDRDGKLYTQLEIPPHGLGVLVRINPSNPTQK